jgi:hypothetical protein
LYAPGWNAVHAIRNRRHRRKKSGASSVGAWRLATSSWPAAVLNFVKNFDIGSNDMTKRIGNKDQAQLRGKAEKKDIKRTNLAREAIKKAIAKSTYRNQVKNRPSAA